MLATPIRFLFDFISPFSYLAWQWIHELAEEHERPVEYQPVLFAALLNHYGHLGPAEIEPKRVYIFKQAVRRAHSMRLPLAPPPAHPFNPLLSLRVASIDLPTERRRAAIDTMMNAVWAGGPGVEDPATLAVQLDAAGLSGTSLVARAGQSDIKARLRASTDQALQQGVFGVPSVIVDGELFWGSDTRDDINTFLNGKDPVTEHLLRRWEQVEPSATRPHTSTR
jgi:2-hydroxychromene-2-carboxylate isomerase